MTYFYRIARTVEDFEQIHKLNYATFVEEIPQHQANEEHRLVDPFHQENTYLLCMKDRQVIGMMAVRSTRPFSLDKKIGPVETKFSTPPSYPVEIRLLSIDKSYRTGRPFLGMVQALVNWCLQSGYDAAFISGTVRELKLYRQLGFVPFAETTGSGEAQFVPMILTLKTYENGVAGRIAKPIVNLLPGPVRVASEVRDALSSGAISHRSPAYQRLLDSVQCQLKELTNAPHVQVLQGTGTLANDVVAAQLKRLSGKGLILVNGEFGSRLCDHARRMNMEFDCLKIEWGDTFDLAELTTTVDKNTYSYIWFVHCETSTSVLNPLEAIKEISKKRGIQIAVDCVSSIGTLPVDLTEIDFASLSSGKGLSSFSGVSFVFHKRVVQPDPTIPRYLDLGTYIHAAGIPYTQSSGLMKALEKAVSRIVAHRQTHFAAIEHRANTIRKALERMDYQVIGNDDSSSPGILTIALKEGESAVQLGEDLLLNGYRTHYESQYLRDRNWVQLATMNEMDESEIEQLLRILERITSFRE